MRRCDLLLWMACALFPIQAAALSLPEAFRMAQDYDAQMRVVAADAAAGIAQVDMAHARLLPQITAAGARGKQRIESSYLAASIPDRTSEPDTENWSLQLRQALYRPMEWRAWKHAEELADASDFAVKAETATLLSRVAKAYLQLLESQAQMEVAQRDVERYAELLRQAERAFQLGPGTRVEIEEVRARLDEARAIAVDWQGRIETGRQELAALIGQDVTPRELVAFEGIRILARDITRDPVNHWIEQLRQKNPELASLQARVDAGRRYVGVQRAGHLPTVDLVASHGFSRSDSITTIDQEHLSTSLSVQVAVPLYSGGGVDASVRSALAGLDREKALLDGRRRELTNVATNAHVQIRFGLEKLNALEQAERSAEQALLATRKGVQAGIRNHVDVLVAEQDVAKVEVRLVSTSYELLRSVMDLMEVTGEVHLALERLDALQ